MTFFWQMGGWTVLSAALDGHPQIAARSMAVLWWSTGMLAGAALAVSAACWLGSKIFYSRWSKSLAGVAGVFAVVAAGAAILTACASTWSWPAAVGQAFSFITVGALGVAAPVGLGAVTVVAWRGSLARGRQVALESSEVVTPSVRDGAMPDSDVSLPQVPAQRTPEDRPCRHAPANKVWADNGCLPEERTPGGTGICLSGGGIRSAAFALGALQVFQRQGQLATAKYLVAVSGGGYAAGALQMALPANRPQDGRTGTDPTAPGAADRTRGETHDCRRAPVAESTATARDVFAAGSPEFDYTRRHSRYLAEGLAQWLRALGVLLRGVLAAQLLLFCTVLLAGRVLGEIYRRMPVLTTPFAALPRQAEMEPGRTAIDYLQGPAPGIAAAVAGTFAAAAIIWAVGVILENSARTIRWSGRLLRAASHVAYLAMALLAVAVVLPLLAVAGQAVYGWYAARDPSLPGPGSTAAAGAATVVTTGYVAAIGAILLAVGRTAGSIASFVRNNRAVIRQLPATIVQWLLVIVGVAVLVGAHLYLFAQVLYGTATAGTWLVLGPKWPDPVRAMAFWIVLGLFIILGLAVDQTRWSLQPFYKERLMTAFAVRRAQDATQGVTARPYNFEDEMTCLAAYGTKAESFPQVIFVAAANVSGQDVTPPGRRALPYTMSGDWVGSPKLGWIRSASLHRLVSHPFRLDLTLQGAMAVSGAAFASAMGASHRPFSLLLTLTNARLGTWLPNPHFLSELAQRSRDGSDPWHLPRPPRWRRLPQLLRELFGLYPWDDRLLLVTDGGHYENLGLVELLRHQPDIAYCLDASGGTTIASGALGPAVSLAYQELGIEISFGAASPDALTAGSAPPTEPPEPLAGRLAANDVLVGTITYPACRHCGEQRHGTLYFGRAVLTSDTPWPVRAYASRNPLFPNDRTSDQWFDHGQFDAYHALGQHVGERLIRRAEQTQEAGKRPEMANATGPEVSVSREPVDRDA